MAKKSSLFIRQSVIGLGFLSGVFTAIGIDPQAILIGIFADAAAAIDPDPRIRYLFVILPALLLLLSIITAYRLGRVFGLVSVIVAYFAGLALLTSFSSALILLGISIVLGYFATNRRLLRKAGFH